MVSVEVLHKIRASLEDLENRPDTLSAAAAFLQRLVTSAAEIAAAAGADEEVRWWAGALERSCTDHRDDLFISPPGCRFHRRRSQAATSSTISLRIWCSPGSRAELARSCRIAAIDAAVDRCVARRNVDGARSDAAWLGQLRRAITDSSQRAADRIKTLEQLASQCQEFADMDFSFLFDGTRDLFAIGYNVGDQRLDDSFYDLLASEARLASYRDDCPGPGQPGTLVRAGPNAHLDGRRDHVAELERLDVRVPDAAAGHADL